MAQTFDDWFENHEDDYTAIIDWLEGIPDTLNLSDFIGSQDIHDFAGDTMFAAYESEAGDYADYKYDQMRDDELLGD